MAIELNPLLWPGDPLPAPLPPPTMADLYAVLEDRRSAPWGRMFWGEPVESTHPAPTGEAIDRCRTLLGILGDLRRVPDDVLPYADGTGGIGAMFGCWRWIMCLNDGRTVAAVLGPKSDYREWELPLAVEGVREALKVFDAA